MQTHINTVILYVHGICYTISLHPVTYRGGGTGTASMAVAVPLLRRMRLCRTKIDAILMTLLCLALALTPAAQDDKCGVKNKYHRSSAPTKTRAVPSTLALSQGI